MTNEQMVGILTKKVSSLLGQIKAEIERVATQYGIAPTPLIERAVICVERILGVAEHSSMDVNLGRLRYTANECELVLAGVERLERSFLCSENTRMSIGAKMKDLDGSCRAAVVKAYDTWNRLRRQNGCAIEDLRVSYVDVLNALKAAEAQTVALKVQKLATRKPRVRVLAPDVAERVQAVLIESPPKRKTSRRYVSLEESKCRGNRPSGKAAKKQSGKKGKKSAATR